MDSNDNKWTELADHMRSVAEARLAAKQLVQGLTNAQFNWCPTAKHWSIGQCLEHLAITGEKPVHVGVVVSILGEPCGGDPSIRIKVSCASKPFTSHENRN